MKTEIYLILSYFFFFRFIELAPIKRTPAPPIIIPILVSPVIIEYAPAKHITIPAPNITYSPFFILKI